MSGQEQHQQQPLHFCLREAGLSEACYVRGSPRFFSEAPSSLEELHTPHPELTLEEDKMCYVPDESKSHGLSVQRKYIATQHGSPDD